MITKEEFAEWKTHPVTIDFFKKAKETKQKLLEDFSLGSTIGYSADETHGLTNKLIGQIEGLNQLINSYYEDEE